MWNLLLGGGTDTSSGEEDSVLTDDKIKETSDEVIKVFQPRKLRQELENGETHTRHFRTSFIRKLN